MHFLHDTLLGFVLLGLMALLPTIIAVVDLLYDLVSNTKLARFSVTKLLQYVADKFSIMNDTS